MEIFQIIKLLFLFCCLFHNQTMPDYNSVERKFYFLSIMRIFTLTVAHTHTKIDAIDWKIPTKKIGKVCDFPTCDFVVVGGNVINISAHHCCIMFK